MRLVKVKSSWNSALLLTGGFDLLSHHFNPAVYLSQEGQFHSSLSQLLNEGVEWV